MVAIVALLLAIPRGWPYGYYELLRFLICGVAMYGAVQAYKQHRLAWIGLLVGMTVLFNPVAPVHFSKSTWRLIDLMTAGLMSLFTIELHLGPNVEKIPFYRRLATWLDENINDTSETEDVQTRYERFTSRATDTIAFAVIAALLGTSACELLAMYIFHWEDTPWWLLLTPPFCLWVWVVYQLSD